ncbi:MAG: OmpA family protein [Chitinophagaceae bacterium]|nr:OmpA family protein [Chitinophagaceae bacterium]
MATHTFKKVLLGLFILTQTVTGSTQETKHPQPVKKRPNIGMSYNLVDFSPSFPRKDSVYGFSLMYWRGISSKLDYSLRYNGIFSNKNQNDIISSNRMSSEAEASLHAKAFRDEKFFNPFLSAGIGIGNYRENRWEPYAPLGAGIQINLKSELYLIAQANYRYSFDEKDLPHNMFYSFGITKSLWAKKKAEIPVVADRDNDGVPDNIDACPDQAGLAALQGCPDRDGDGIADKDDECPDAAGPASLKGCPDRDGDGIADKNDKCPDVKGVARYEGCPIPDTDKDGINDEEDKCPTVFGLARYQGCPIPDTDGDGINDEEDKCPNLAGVRENQGCPAIPEEVKKKVSIAAKNILFVTGSAKLQTSSYKGLNEVAKILQENPEMKLNIDGHTDYVGSEEMNQTLSDNRSASVKEYFVSKGIDESRIRSAGHGEMEPIADNKTAAGRQKNRRVELLLSYFQ